MGHNSLSFYGDKFVGNIDEFIIERFYNNDHKLCEVKIKDENNDEYTFSVFKYENGFPLILDEVKKLFDGIKSLNYIKVSITTDPTIKNSSIDEYLMYRHLESTPLHEHELKPNFRIDLRLQNVFVFNWLMGITNYNENKIFAFKRKFITDSNSNDVSYATVNEKRCNILTEEKIYNLSSSTKIRDEFANYPPSKHILDKWFGGGGRGPGTREENFYRIAKNLVINIDPTLLKIKMLKIVKMYDESFKTWVDFVFDRVRNIKDVSL
jgi:hypothetical protein